MAGFYYIETWKRSEKLPAMYYSGKTFKMIASIYRIGADIL